MSSSNPFRSVESTEESAESTLEVDPARIEELEDQVVALEERLDDEESKSDPDYECLSEDCEGFGIEEIESDHVTTQKTLTGDDTRPKRMTCPHCGEEIRVQKLIPKKEQRTGSGRSPIVSNDKAAGEKVRMDLEDAGKEDVLEEAESRWTA